MKQKDRLARDAFTFSLDGMRMVNSFAIVPMIAHDSLRQDRDGPACSSHGPKRRPWMPRFLRVA